MQYKNILVPFDGSEHAVNAVKAAKDLAGDAADVTIHVLNVVDPGETEMGVGEYEEYKRMLDTKKAEGQKTLASQVEDAVGTTEGFVIKAVTTNSPVTGITRYVEENGIDLIIMGRRGLGALRGMLGSVSYAVLHAVDVPVMTVK